MELECKKIAEDYIKNIGYNNLRLIVIENNSDFYCFSYYHPTEILVGHSCIMINKIDNRLFKYGSATDFDNAKKDFLALIKNEKKVRSVIPEFDIQKTYNFIILKIVRKWLVIDKIFELKFTYITPEIVATDIFRIAKNYDKKLIEKRLQNVPCEFKNINGETIVELVNANNEKKMFDFTLSEYIPIKKINNVKRATEKDLETEW